jgi:hypothetical protein
MGLSSTSQRDSQLLMAMLRNFVTDYSAYERNSILKKIIKENRYSVDVNEAHNKISMFKSNGISAQQNIENIVALRTGTQYSEKSQSSSEVAHIYLYSQPELNLIQGHTKVNSMK